MYDAIDDIREYLWKKKIERRLHIEFCILMGLAGGVLVSWALIVLEVI